MNEIQRKDLTLRAISILFAIILWFAVMDSVNPMDSITLTVPLRTINETTLQDKNIALKDPLIKQTIDITVRDRNNKVKNLRPDDFEAVLDFAKVNTAGRQEVAVTITSLRKDMNLPKSDYTISLNLEKVITKTFPVTLQIAGKIKSGYKIINQSVVPQTIEIKGFESVINSIGQVAVDVDVLDRDVAVNKACDILNSAKRTVEVGKSFYVNVNVQVAKEVTVSPVIEGVPGEDYYVKEVNVLPRTVQVTGSAEILSSLGEVKTKSIYINNINRDTQYKGKLDVPKGIKIVDDITEADVDVVVEQLPRKEIVVSKENIQLKSNSVDDSLNYSIVTQYLSLKIKGLKGDLDKVDVATLNPLIDVTGLTEGNHKVALKVALPASVKLEGNYTVEVKVEKIAPASNGESVTEI